MNSFLFESLRVQWPILDENISSRYWGVKPFSILNVKMAFCLSRFIDSEFHCNSFKRSREEISYVDWVMTRAALFWSF